MANLSSLLILLLFLYGRSLRFTNLKRHIQLMLLAMILDVGLVLALVFYRDALTKVNMGMPWTLQIHVPIAVSTVIIYFFTAWAGYQLYRGDERARPRLRVFDKVLLTLRILTLVTSVMVQVLRV